MSQLYCALRVTILVELPAKLAREYAVLGGSERQGGEILALSSQVFVDRNRTPQASRLRPRHLARAAIVPARRVAASPAQRLKVAASSCLVCGRFPVDPAHLVPQRLGGCAAPECVVALCRTHHRLFDSARLALALYLGPDFDAELAHALKHVSEAELEEALVRGWPAHWQSEQDEGGSR